MIRDLLALRPIWQFTQKTLSYLHSTKIEQMTKTMVILKTGAIFLCCIRCDPIPRQTSVQRLAHTRNVTTCCYLRHVCGDSFHAFRSPRVSGVEMEIYERSLQALLSSAPSLVRSREAHFAYTQIGELPRRLDENQNLIRTLEICVGLSWGTRKVPPKLKMLILTSKLLKEPSNRAIAVFPFF